MNKGQQKHHQKHFVLFLAEFILTDNLLPADVKVAWNTTEHDVPQNNTITKSAAFFIFGFWNITVILDYILISKQWLRLFDSVERI